MDKFVPSAIATVIASTLATNALANDFELPDGMERIVVTATGFEQKLTEAPASISIITNEEIRSRSFTSLLDAVKYQEGIDIGTSRDKTGQGSISMRGLTGDYTLILVDGIRQNNHGDIYPNNFGGNAFNHIPPLETIDRIEVIRGPASTLYGADALGGVINVITKKHTDDWSGAITFGRSVQTDDNFGDDFTTDFSATGPLIKDVLSLGVRASLYDQQASSPQFEPAVDPNGTVHIRELGFGSGGRTVDNKDEHYGFSVSYTPAKGHNVKFDYDNSHQSYDNTPSYDVETDTITYPLGTKDSIESIWQARGGQVNPRAGYAADQSFDRTWWSIAHDADWSFGSSMVSLAYVDTQNNGRTLPLSVDERLLLQQMYDGTGDYSGLPEDERRSIAEETFLPRPDRPLDSSQYTLDAKLDIPFSGFAGHHNLVISGQLIDGELKDGVFGLEEGNAGAVQEQKMYSLFVEDNWMPIADFTLTGGVRYDEHDVFGSQVSPRLYAVYNLSPAWTVKGGVSTGYKTPKTTDLYDGIVGFGGQGTMPFAGNPELQPETSVNSEIALYWNSDNGDNNFNITYFNTGFEDKIARGDTVQSCEQTGGVRPCVNLGEYEQLGYDTWSQSINIDEVDVQGVEVAARYVMSETWSIRGNYTWTDSEQKSGSQAGLPLTNTAEHMANLWLNWQASDVLTVYLQGELRSDRYRGYDSNIDKQLYFENYSLLNLGANYKLTESVDLNLRINNLLDRDFTTYSTTYTDLNGDGEFEYVTGRGAVSEVVFTDDYNVKDKTRNLWMGVTVSF
ncbi:MULTISPECIES: TonB-dependent receptor [Idiomarina]|jgi:outer membrane receptor for ferrienterochelin and colicins|uniref:TonB-dependent receptor domain-containing protein n=1 Tax=Idiomarina TaxID=135575 RepID=UPI000C37F926|nr:MULTISPECIES: TonB-dependent receptor [Idiomarina]MAO67737.1 TonB-dependent receptor [Idiomarina sp.]MBF79390.1 TonB-dependent receptor [Idiomarina sp.]|tara:strand:+ start:10095 stop:12470 length:2376 start_codon:yes stop_codon:yes gene_type:complete